MDGSHTLAYIASECSVSESEIRKLVSRLERERIIEKASGSARDSDDRYSRQLNFFASFETARIKKYDYHRAW